MGSLTRSVVKALGLLTGVQAITVVSSVVRVKLVAIWLGATGIGLFGIYQTALDMLGTVAQMGIGVSATRRIAAADTPTARSRAVAVARAWGWRLALLGLLLTLLVSPWLSLWSFDSVTNADLFMVLGIGVALMVAMSTMSAILQGMGSYGAVAKGTVVGSVGGLVVTIPLLLCLGNAGIVPSVVAFTLATALGMWWMTRRDCAIRALPPLPASLTRADITSDGSGLLRLGWWVTLAYAAASLASYALLSYINRVADTTQVGYFQAGYTLLVRYSSFILGALAVEYFPRISAVHRSTRRLSIYASHEMSLLMLVFVPVSAAFIAAGPLIVKLLYTDGFEVVLPYIYTGAAGALLRCWCISLSYVILAKGDGPRYLLTECVSAAVFLCAGLIFYRLYGLDGMGVAYVVSYVSDSLMLWIITRRGYGLRLSGAAVRLSAAAFAIVAICSLMPLLLPDLWLGNAICAIVAIGSGGFAFVRLRRLR